MRISELLYHLTIKQARRIIIFIVGITVLLLGIILIFTPGPALLVIPAGLVILGTEFVWARRLVKKMKNTIKKR